MVTRKTLTARALAVGLSAGLLAQIATASDAPAAQWTPVAADFRVDEAEFRSDIERYIRALNAELRIKLDQDLRRELAPKLELASNELRARG